MSRIDELIESFCPDGVPLRRLGEFAELVRGNGLPKSDFVPDGVGAIHYGQIYTKFGTWTTKTISHVKPEIAEKLTKVNPGDIIITNTSENLEDVGKAVAWLGENQIVTGGHATVIKHQQDSKFLAYWFQSPSFRLQKRGLATGTKVIDVSAKQLEKVLVPVPPLEVQREIVRILDQFTQLEAELEAELEARRRQFEFFAETLLATNSDVPIVKLGEVTSIVRGASPRPIQKFITTDDTGIPWIKIGDVPTDGKYITQTAQMVTLEGAAKSRYVDPGDFVLSNSMSFGRPYILKIRGCIHDGWLAISDFQETFDSNYLYYLLRSAAVQSQFESKAGSGTVRNLNADIVRSVTVPVPTRERQELIVDQLDKFNALTTDLYVGLPAELKARRKQYEYYRNKLLTFKELAA